MQNSLAFLLTAISAYLLGSLNTAVLVSRLTRRDDVRTHGSGNAGAANMFRTFGRRAGLATVLGDLIKAIVAVLLARLIFWGLSSGWFAYDPGYFAGLFVLFGHIYPIYFKFKGGKGVMPAVGVILMVHPLAFVILVVIAIPVFLATRTMSIVSLTCATALPWIVLIVRQTDQSSPVPAVLYCAAYAILVIVSHRDNIKRLVHKTEKPILPR